MKNYFMVVLLVCCFVAVNSQAQSASARKEKVRIIHSGARAVMLLDDYFNIDVTKQILKQVSPARLIEVKKYCNENSYPHCFGALIDANEENELFSNVTAYRIAKFDNISNGENFGEQSILLVPASENKNLMGSSCVFEQSFYIIIYSKDVEIVEE